MKKIIRVLGVTLSLVVLASCSKDDTGVENVTLDPQNITNKYTYQVALVPVAVDLDKDGKVSQNLMNENVNQCVWDNVLEFKGDRFTITDKGNICDPTATSDILLDAKYILNKEAATIKLYDNANVEIEILTKVEIGYEATGDKYVTFEIYDKELKQNVKYSIAAAK